MQFKWVKDLGEGESQLSFMSWVETEKKKAIFHNNTTSDGCDNILARSFRSFSRFFFLPLANSSDNPHPINSVQFLLKGQRQADVIPVNLVIHLCIEY